MEVEIDPLGVLVSVIIALVILVLQFKAKKPKLIIAGGGGGGGGPGSVNHTSIGIRNDPRFLGMPINRQTAKITKAYIIDKKTKEYYPLPGNWQEVGASVSDTTRETSIEVGERKNLNVFVQDPQSGEYCVCGQNILKIPSNSQGFSDHKKKFTLFIRDSVGRKYKFKILVKNRPKKIQVMYATTFAHRLDNVRGAFLQLGKAFNPRIYR